MRWLTFTDPCVASRAAIQQASAAAAGTTGYDVTLDVAAAANLLKPANPGDSIVGACPLENPYSPDASAPRGCMLVDVSGPGIPHTVIRNQPFWYQTECVRRAALYDEPPRGAISMIQGDGSRVRFVAGEGLELIAVP